MNKPVRTATPARRWGLWITIAVAFVYCGWLATQWLPMGLGNRELAASASRVWDVKQELTGHGQLPWWTPNFMSGSSYALNHARGFYLLPWMLLSNFTDLISAGKLVMLAGMFISALAMYFCARRLLRHEWAAALAALAFLLHPQQVVRAIAAEHVTISLFFMFIPLLWLTFARSLESNRLRDALLCAIVVMLALWTDTKQAVVHGLFLTGYLVYWLCSVEHRREWQKTARTCAITAAGVALMGMFIIVPGFSEQSFVKLFQGDPLLAWQKNYGFKSLFGLVDRYAVASTPAREGVRQATQKRGGPRSQAEADQVHALDSIGSDSPEKYAGIVCLLLVGVTALFNARRQNRSLFWLFIGFLLLSVMLATGLNYVWKTNADIFSAWFGLDGVPGLSRLVALLAVLGLAGFLFLFARRKLTTPGKWLFAGGALTLFLFLPAFKIAALFPLYKDIRAPYTFYDGPSAFILAMLLGFLVTDVLDNERWRKHLPKLVAGVVALLALDYWPYMKWGFTGAVPAHTATNLRATYTALAKDPDPVKVHVWTGRYFHLLGPMYSGKPQVYEAFYNWMAPLGTGLLNQIGPSIAFNTVEALRIGKQREAQMFWMMHRGFLDALSVRYVIFDKTDPDAAGYRPLADIYRQVFPIHLENEDFVVFRNETARPYVSANARRCLYVGDLTNSPVLAIELIARDYTLVHGTRQQATGSDRVYDGSSQPYLPVAESAPLPLTDVHVNRENHHTVRLALTAPTNCVAVIAESYYPFWKATVDGQPAEVLRVDCALMGLNLTGGHHDIVLRYEPPRSYAMAGIVSMAALVVCLGIIVFPTKRPSAAAPPPK